MNSRSTVIEKQPIKQTTTTTTSIEEHHQPNFKLNMKNLEAIFNKANSLYYKQETDVRDIIADVCQKKLSQENFDSFYLVELSHVVKQFLKWFSLMPRIRPYYAIKCNPDRNLIAILKELGCGFDCASLNEIKLVTGLDGKKLDNEEDIIFANPCKQVSHIRYAKEEGVNMTTFDSADELYKIKKYYPEARVVLRLAVDDSKSICRFSSKFGCPFDDAEELVVLCKKLKLNLYGVSFHVGSGCTDTMSFVSAIMDARKLFNIALNHGIKMSFLDIGGGFPGVDNNENYSNISFTEIAKAVYPVINKVFPLSEGVKVIAEPGRYFACGSSTLVCNIYAIKEPKKKLSAVSTTTNADKKDEKPLDFMYYLNDGIYQSFNCIIFDHLNPEIKPFKKNYFLNEEGKRIKNYKVDDKKYVTKLFGPTCDSMDTIYSDYMLPKMEREDWLYVEDFGAYTLSASCNFNGFDNPEIIYYWKS